MENASKALIIAGAILLSILIIGLGMTIFNQASDAMGNSGLESEQAQAFNSKFEANIGENIKGSAVRTLLRDIRTYNTTEEDDDEKIEVVTPDVSATKEASQIDTGYNKIKPSAKYNVSVTDYSEEGYIRKVEVTAASTTPSTP